MTPTERKLRTALVYIRKKARGYIIPTDSPSGYADIFQMADDAIKAIPKDRPVRKPSQSFPEIFHTRNEESMR